MNFSTIWNILTFHVLYTFSSIPHFSSLLSFILICFYKTTISDWIIIIWCYCIEHNCTFITTQRNINWTNGRILYKSLSYPVYSIQAFAQHSFDEKNPSTGFLPIMFKLLSKNMDMNLLVYIESICQFNALHRSVNLYFGC